MPYVYRRPFDYPQHRQAFNVWAMGGLVEAVAATGAFTAFPATVTATSSTDQYSRATRFSTQGVYRKRWPFAEHNARIVLIYKDADAIDAQLGSAAFTTFRAAVQVGSSSGVSLNGVTDTAAFGTFTATLEGGRRDPLGLGLTLLSTYAASVTRTAGLGQSRTGAVSAKASGTYQPGSTRAPRRRVVSRTNQIVKAK